MKKAQTALEYLVLVAIVAGALIVMQVYIRRGISGGWRRAVDDVGEQYAPKNTVADINYTLESNTVSNLTLEGNIQKCDTEGCFTNRIDYTNSYETRNGTYNLSGY